MNRKQPIRTYQRKITKRTFVNASVSSAISSVKYNSMRNNFDKSITHSDSFNYDPFETTFDRIAEGAVVPPLSLDANQNDSWKSSSDSDINDATNKSPGHTSDLFIHNSTSRSIYVRHKHRKDCKSKVTTSTGILSRKTRVKNKTQLQKVQGQKRQMTKIQEKKKLKNKFKSSRTCNRQVYVNSNAMDNSRNNLCKSDNECLHQNTSKTITKTNKSITSQNKSVRMNDSIVDFKCTANHQQIIKPCFVKLNACAVQNYILNCKKITKDKQDILHNAECLDILQSDEDISKIQNIIPQSVSTEYNDFESFKHISVKQCSVVLCNIIEDWYELKNNRNMKDIINIKDKSSINRSQLVSYNSSEIASDCTKNIEFSSPNTRKIEDLKRNDFIKIERLKVREKNVKDGAIFNEKKHNIVSSTPIGKRGKPSTNLVIFSPINSNIHDKLHWSKESSLMTAKDDISNIDSHPLITLSEYKLDPADIQEQQTQVLLLSQKSQTSTDSIIENEIMSWNSTDNLVVTQKCETKCNGETKIPNSLNMSTVNTDQSRSLFDDTGYNHSMKDTDEDNMQEIYFSGALTSKGKINTINSSIDSEQKQLSRDNEQSDASLRYISPSKLSKTFRNLDNFIHIRQKCDSEFQKNYGIRINAVETVHKNLKNETDVSKYSILNNSKDNINIVDPRVLLTRLQDPIRIGKRTQYPKWDLSVSNISNTLNNEATQSNNEILRFVANDENFSNVQSIYNSEHSKSAINSSLDYSASLNGTTQCNNTNKQIEKSIFLKSGKHWARSLSILNNINDGSDLNKLSIGKGKKWRHSVKDILNMQKRGIFQSCLKKGKDDVDLSNDGFIASNVSSFNNNSCKEFNLANYARFSKRISMRVVLNTSTKCDIKDTPFLEAFGITTERSSSLKPLYGERRREELLTHDRIINSYSTTARDVVLQRCSQNCYMSFTDRFPDSYLEHCHKIGEGVYGEVFLYEYGDKKSVIKIIPIENEQLVNGEPQKKFSEILSEIVIAKELDDLKLNATYKTNGFIEVKSISCIVGKYPKKLIELWNVYDNDKTSDNDCPSMFSENQLYIALELGHGGEDLEAFVFQTAEEAYALFLQIALALAIAEKALEFEHRDLHWGNILVSRTKESYIYYNLDGKEIKFPSKGVKVSIIDFTLSRMSYQGCCIYNDLALDPALFTAHGEYQFEIYRLMRDKIQNNWRKFEPYTNVLWLHYILDKMITAVRYKKKNLKVHKHTIIRLKDFKDTILNYDSVYDFIINSNSVVFL